VSTGRPPHPEIGMCQRLAPQQTTLSESLAMKDPHAPLIDRRTWYHMEAPTVDRDHATAQVAGDAKVITLMRSPADRLLSAFTQLQTHLSCCAAVYHEGQKWTPKGQSWGWEFHVRRDAQIAAAGEMQLDPNATDVSHPARISAFLEVLTMYNSLWGCQTKMLLGYGCHESHHITRAQRERALRLVSGDEPGIAFVGLTERYVESVCLFHVLQGGPVYAFEVDLGEHESSRTSSVTPADIQAFTGGDLDPDTELFARVTARFNASITEHAAEMADCLASMPSGWSGLSYS